MPSLGYCIIVIVGIRRLHSMFRFSVSNKIQFLIPITPTKSNSYYSIDASSVVEKANSVLFTEHVGSNGHQDLHKE